MEKQEVLKAIKEIREKSPKKKFSQAVDLIINLQNLDLKKPEHKMDISLQLPFFRGRKPKICAFVDAQLGTQAKKLCDTIVLKEDFAKWQNNKKEQKKLANNNDIFISQVELISQVAAIFGKVLGSRGKMPNPKAGCVVPGAANLEPIINRLQNTVRLQTKNELIIKLAVGKETMKDEELADNILSAYNTLLSKLPQEKNNIRFTAIKLTMGPICKIGDAFKKEK